MKTLEYQYGGDWRDRVLNSWPFALDTKSIRTVAVAWDREGTYQPGTRSLFYNGFVMLRLSLPPSVFIHIKPWRSCRFQCGIGWALNGRFKLLFRIQTDASAAAGVHGPNYGQAAGWERGTA